MADEQAEGPEEGRATEDPAAADPAADPPAAAPRASAPTEALLAAEAAFERGDYAEVRQLATPLAQGKGPTAEAAAGLLQRTRVDPAQVGVVVACLLFFCFIVWKYVL